MTSNDQLTLARLSTMLNEATALLRQQAEITQQIVQAAERSITLIEAKGRCGFVEDQAIAESKTKLNARQLRAYRENGTFEYGVHYRDIRSAGATQGTYQYHPDNINQLFAIPPEKRTA
jgi:hypothetical protein